MVPFEVITNSCSRNYRLKSLPTQPRIDVMSRSTSDDRDDGGEPGRKTPRASAGAEAHKPYINAPRTNLLRTPRSIRPSGAQVLGDSSPTVSSPSRDRLLPGTGLRGDRGPEAPGAGSLSILQRPHGGVHAPAGAPPAFHSVRLGHPQRA